MDSQETPLKGLTMYLELTQTQPFLGFNHQGNSWKGTGGIRGKRGESEVTGNRANAGRQLPPRQSPEARQWYCPLSEHSSTQSQKAMKEVASPGNYLRL